MPEKHFGHGGHSGGQSNQLENQLRKLDKRIASTMAGITRLEKQFSLLVRILLQPKGDMTAEQEQEFQVELDRVKNMLAESQAQTPAQNPKT